MNEAIEALETARHKVDAAFDRAIERGDLAGAQRLCRTIMQLSIAIRLLRVRA